MQISGSSDILVVPSCYRDTICHIMTRHFNLFLVVVTDWLKEQSPLTEDELQKLCISMDDFKVCGTLFIYHSFLEIFTKLCLKYSRFRALYSMHSCSTPKSFFLVISIHFLVEE